VKSARSMRSIRRTFAARTASRRGGRAGCLSIRRTSSAARAASRFGGRRRPRRLPLDSAAVVGRAGCLSIRRTLPLLGLRRLGGPRRPLDSADIGALGLRLLGGGQAIGPPGRARLALDWADIAAAGRLSLPDGRHDVSSIGADGGVEAALDAAGKVRDDDLVVEAHEGRNAEHVAAVGEAEEPGRDEDGAGGAASVTTAAMVGRTWVTKISRTRSAAPSLVAPARRRITRLPPADWRPPRSM